MLKDVKNILLSIELFPTHFITQFAWEKIRQQLLAFENILITLISFILPAVYDMLL